MTFFTQANRREVKNVVALRKMADNKMDRYVLTFSSYFRYFVSEIPTKLNSI